MNLNIKIESIEKIYTGKSGCMCGCRGKYVEGKTVGRVLKNMQRFVENNSLQVTYEGGHIFVDDGNRTYVIYTK